MCGIAGELRFRARPTQANWQTISALMVRRGPDDSGTWRDQYCNLVFRRLSIIDLSPAGHQPMVSADGRYMLVFNGEVYNFPDWQLACHRRLPETWMHRLFPGESASPVDYKLYEYDGCEQDDAAQWLRWNEFVSHLAGVLLKVNRASMYNSLKVRVPLLDREVIDVAVQVDWRDCFDPKQRAGKLPLRRSLARHVQFQTSTKKGFEPPMGKWLRISLRPVMEETLLTRDSLAGVPVDRRALRALYQEHLDERQDFGWGLWPLLSLALWEQRHGRGRG